MSTRCSVQVKDFEGNVKQFYHHTDGYPEYMGEFLKGAMLMNCFIGQNTSNNIFFELLEKEGHFEEEEVGFVHGDWEYFWFVDFNRGSTDFLHYVEISPFGNCEKFSELKKVEYHKQ